MIDFSGIKACTFDCYGTLIDWQHGILAALRPHLDARAITLPDAEVLRRYAAAELAAEGGAYRPYREVLEEVARAFFGDDCSRDERESLWRSVGEWPAFEETPRALARLKGRYRVAVLSNVDDDLFALTRPKLGVELDEVVTAERVRSYKPGRAHFDEALRRLSLTSDEVLHIAESRRHDVAPARALGFATVWVNRAQGAASASGESDAEPDLIVPTLTDLADLIEIYR